MARLLTLLGESFALLGRNLVLFYPVLIYLIFFDVIRPRGMMVSADAKWLAFAGLLMLLLSAFSAGWFNMVYMAVLQHRKPASPALTGEDVPDEAAMTRLTETFAVFKAFFPGVGEYFFRFALGWLVFFGVLAIMLWVAHGQVMAGGGYPAVFEEMITLIQRGPEAQRELEALTRNLSPEVMAQMGAVFSIFGGTMTAFSLFALVTIFWAPLVIMRQLGAFRAYLESLRLFFRNPFKLMALGIFYFAAFMLVGIVGGLNPILGIIGWFLWLFVDIAFVVFLFLYLTDEYGLQHVLPPAGSPAGSSAENPGDDSHSGSRPL